MHKWEPNSVHLERQLEPSACRPLVRTRRLKIPEHYMVYGCAICVGKKYDTETIYIMADDIGYTMSYRYGLSEIRQTLG